MLAGCATQPPIVTADKVPPAAIAKAAQAIVERQMARDQAAATEAQGTVVAAADLMTLPQVAAFLAKYNLRIAPAAWDRWHWTPAAAGASPVGWYVVRVQWAVPAGAEPWGELMIQNNMGDPYMVKVRAVDVADRAGPWSLVGWSDGSNDGAAALPGVGSD